MLIDLCFIVFIKKKTSTKSLFLSFYKLSGNESAQTFRKNIQSEKYVNKINYKYRVCILILAINN